MIDILKKILFYVFKPKKSFWFFWENTKIHFFNWFQNPKNIEIWSHCFIYYWNMFLPWEYKIKIGDAVHIAMNNLFITYSHDFNALDIESIPYDKRYTGWDIIIGDCTWIWTKCIVLPWVKIWKGCVIAAGSVVSKNIPDYEVWWGNPAKRISERKNKEQFDTLYSKKNFRRKFDS